MRLAVPDLISNSYFPAISAVELGDFAEQGLDVRHELIFPVDKSYQALRDGEVDFIGGSAHAVLSAFPAKSPFRARILAIFASTLDRPQADAISQTVASASSKFPSHHCTSQLSPSRPSPLASPAMRRAVAPDVGHANVSVVQDQSTRTGCRPLASTQVSIAAIPGGRYAFAISSTRP